MDTPQRNPEVTNVEKIKVKKNTNHAGQLNLGVGGMKESHSLLNG